MRNGFGMLILLAVPVVHGLGGCGGDDDLTTGSGGSGGAEPTGAICEADDECYPDVADGALVGDALCLADVRGGYCTHTCTADDDCCAAPGECATDVTQFCSPYQSGGPSMCFLSCEPHEHGGAGGETHTPVDEQYFCQAKAGPAFVCRASGAGSESRKICVPGDCGVGAACDDDADCSGGLSCFLDPRGGYCTVTGCSDHGDCPSEARCVRWGTTETYCAVLCDRGSDCNFCRGGEIGGTCIGGTPAPGGDPIMVCVPPR